MTVGQTVLAVGKLTDRLGDLLYRRCFLDFVSGDKKLKRTEIVSEYEASPGPDLPYPVSSHCIVRLSEESIYLIGGLIDEYADIIFLYFSICHDLSLNCQILVPKTET